MFRIVAYTGRGFVKLTGKIIINFRTHNTTRCYYQLLHSVLMTTNWNIMPSENIVASHNSGQDIFYFQKSLTSLPKHRTIFTGILANSMTTDFTKMTTGHYNNMKESRECNNSRLTLVHDKKVQAMD